MSNVFQKFSDKFKDSPIAIPVTLACLLGIAIAIAATIADYRSSYEGYIQLPTEKVPEVVWLIAMLPQVGQIIFGTWFTLTFEKANSKVKANWLYFIVFFFLFLWDNGTDIYYKTAGFTYPVYVWLIALIESVTIYTIGSELLLIASFGLFIYLLPLALDQVGILFSRLSGGDGTSAGSTPPGMKR